MSTDDTIADKSQNSRNFVKHLKDETLTTICAAEYLGFRFQH